MVFNRVGARDDVLAHIMLEHVITLSRQVRAAARHTSEASPPQRLEAMLTACVDGIAAAPHAHTLLHNALCVLPPTSRDVVRRRYRMLLDLLAQPLALLAPSVGDTLAAELALTTVGSVSDALLWVDPAARYEVAVTVRRLTAMLLTAVRSAEGLGPQPGRGGPTQDCAQPWLHGDASGTLCSSTSAPVPAQPRTVPFDPWHCGERGRRPRTRSIYAPDTRAEAAGYSRAVRLIVPAAPPPLTQANRCRAIHCG